MKRHQENFPKWFHSTPQAKSSKNLYEIQQMEIFCIYKPKKLIFTILAKHSVRFFFLSLLSFYPCIFFVIPAYYIVIYEFYVSLKWLEKFNISPFKITLLILAAFALFIISAPYVRKCIWAGVVWFFKLF